MSGEAFGLGQNEIAVSGCETTWLLLPREGLEQNGDQCSLSVINCWINDLNSNSVKKIILIILITIYYAVSLIPTLCKNRNVKPTK